MSVQELLAQVAVEHEDLYAKYNKALEEVDILRSRLADVEGLGPTPADLAVNTEGVGPSPENLAIETEGPNLAFQTFAWDREAAPTWHHDLLHEPIHRAPAEACEAWRASATAYSNSVADREADEEGEKRDRLTLTKDDSSKLLMMTSRSRNSMEDGRHPLVRFFQNPNVECFLVLVVISNIVLMWLETDRRAAKIQQPVWEAVLNKVYLAIYVCEFALRVLAYRTEIFLDSWAKLDAAVLAIDFLMWGFELATSGDALFGFNASIFRLLRVFRMLRIVKVLRSIIEIQLLVHGFAIVMKAVFFAAVMLQVVVLLWAFIFVEVIQPHVLELSASGALTQCSRCESSYDSMWHAHLTIYQQVIAGDSWGIISIDVMRASPATSLIFLGALVTIQFAVLNLIFTVIVDAAARGRAEDEQQQLANKQINYEKQKKKLLHLCGSLDQDTSGHITFDELRQGFRTNPTFADCMHSLDLTFEDMSILFMIMDEDRSGGVSYVEFVNNIYRMKEQDMRTMLMMVRVHAMDIRFKLKEDIDTIKKMFGSLQESVQKTDNVDARMQHVEQLSADTLSILSARKDQDTDTLHQMSAPDMKKLEQDVKEISNLQVRLLAAVQQQARAAGGRGEDKNFWCNGPTKRLPLLVKP